MDPLAHVFSFTVKTPARGVRQLIGFANPEDPNNVSVLRYEFHNEGFAGDMPMRRLNEALKAELDLVRESVEFRSTCQASPPPDDL